MYKRSGELTCKIRDAEIKIKVKGIEISTEDTEITSPWNKIKYCEVLKGKHKKFGHCKYKKHGGIFIQVDPEEKEMIAVASRGPLMAQITAAENEVLEV